MSSGISQIVRISVKIFHFLPSCSPYRNCAPDRNKKRIFSIGVLTFRTFRFIIGTTRFDIVIKSTGTRKENRTGVQFFYNRNWVRYRILKIMRSKGAALSQNTKRPVLCSPEPDVISRYCPIPENRCVSGSVKSNMKKWKFWVCGGWYIRPRPRSSENPA